MRASISGSSASMAAVWATRSITAGMESGLLPPSRFLMKARRSLSGR